MLGGLIFDQCPKAWSQSVNPDLLETLKDVYNFRRTGALPSSGGWLDQHPHWIEVEEIVSQVEGEYVKDGSTKR